MAPSQLEIKVKALQRLVKEEQYYQQELKDQSAHVEKLKQDSSIDPYDLRKQVEVLQDTERLLPTFYTKLAEFKDNLEEYLKSYDGNESVADAENILAVAKDVLVARKA